ncbi:NACHT domain-containing protein [Aliarcobacter butzleri]|uniref:NACHT domain-containing protein n=1 Tax=Aliarcobacter butzleri TaxID=28197 RepID=UPI0021B6B49F|nr:NACHT domain-containing protein [Aliarcobacter butzleri]MCT7587094.1 NACHT domain-containing protein [Aliarcobacter butzleri]
MNVRDIEIFETDNNKKGDLFSRLIGDLFHALGYGKARFDIHKSGRELDIEVHHRTEKKIAIAECKAHKETIGGGDLNKFFGALETERNKYKRLNYPLDNTDIIGYFISISGFKETAIEQEKDNDNKRMILIDGKKIVEELISGKIIVSIEQAIDNVPKIDGIRLLNDVDLIASNIGWIWVLYFGQNQTTSHFSLIHAEGNPLVAKLAQQIISIDKKLSKKFENLEYISPLEKKDMLSLSKQAKEKYFKYIECECGEIQFEGLPTDKDAGSVKVKLENIFEPLHLERVMDEDNELDIIDIRESFGEVLANNNRLAILAKPGGGKSTLIKRIAVAYAYPEKISLVHDYLPKKEYFPIFIRCRELGEKVKSSITDIIFSISNKAEIEDLKEGFYKIVSDALQNGTALLLIDGLDEISIDRDRIYFVNQLRIFLARYPNISIITTSRKAGFRAVGGILADYCTKYEISNLNQLEIRELSKKWHIAIIDDSKNTIDESNELVNQILADGRITVLAENPLLLTTLLFVKRWAGYLPTKRHILYQEMIKLLLVTWNVEGHEQLDIDETEPQLSFVAYWMSENGKQTITEKELKKCLNDARKQMPDVLGYTNITVSNFIKRVESRSSLLIMSGHKQLEDKSIVPVYEFLHLSFQEYLTAKAVVEKSLPSNLHNETNLNILKPHILKENWKEIIPLVAVLSKRDNKELIKYLIDKSKISANNRKINKNNVQKYSPMLLGNCIANEIQISPELLKEALEWYAKNRYNLNNERVTEIIMNGKFGDTFQEVIEELFFNTYIDEFSSELGGLLGEIFILRLDGDSNCSILKEIQSQIMNKNKKKSCIGISALMSYSFEKTRIKEKEVCDQETYNQFIKGLLEVLLSKLNENDKHYLFLIPWTIAWIYDDKNALINIGISNEWIYKLINIWLDNNEHNIVRVSAWALNEVFNATSDIVNHINLIEDIKNKIQKKYDEPLNEFDKYIAIYIGIELQMPWSKKDLKTFFSNDNLRRNLENDRLYKFYIKKLGIRIKKLEEISELTHFE